MERTTDELAIKAVLADREQELNTAFNNLARIQDQLRAPSSDLTLRELQQAVTNWQEFADRHHGRASSILDAVTHWYGVLVENNSPVREALVVVRWKWGTDYLLTWRPMTPDKRPFSVEDDSWLRRYWPQKELPVKQLADRFPDREFATIERHARDVLGISRLHFQGGVSSWGAGRFRREWQRDHAHFTQKNKGILFGALLSHPTNATEMIPYGMNGKCIDNEPMPLPDDVRVRLQRLVQAGCPELP